MPPIHVQIPITQPVTPKCSQPLQPRSLMTSYPPVSHRANRHALFASHPPGHPLPVDNPTLDKLPDAAKHMRPVKRQPHIRPPPLRLRILILIRIFFGSPEDIINPTPPRSPRDPIIITRLLPPNLGKRILNNNIHPLDPLPVSDPSRLPKPPLRNQSSPFPRPLLSLFRRHRRHPPFPTPLTNHRARRTRQSQSSHHQI